MARQLEPLRIAFLRVFSSPAYGALAGVLAALAFVLSVWFPNLGLLAQVWSDSSTPLAARLDIALSLLGGIGTNFSLLSAGYTIAIAVLFGLVAAMIVYALKHRHAAKAGKSVTIGSGAVVSGVVGIGCAACGSLVMGVILPSLGAGGALAAMPLGGEEFGILSVVLLGASLLLISKGIAEPTACPPVSEVPDSDESPSGKG